MSDDFYVEQSYQSGISRLGKSIVGVIFGFIFLIVSFPLLFWNEARAVKTAKSLEEGASVVVSISSDKIDIANENKLVHFTGQATTNQELSDSQFNVSAKAIKLHRIVELYQWKESKREKEEKTLTGGTKKVTTYSYDKVWSENLINSNNFKQSTEHNNPSTKPYESQYLQAEQVRVGAFTLSKSLVNNIDNFQSYDVSKKPISNGVFKVVNGYYYKGNTPNSPQIGDCRVKFQVVNPTQVSIIAKQTQNSLSPYQTNAGRDIELITVGTTTAQEMFKSEQQSNTVITWILRLVGFLLMLFGLLMIASPLTTLLDIIPLVGGFFSSIVGASVFLFSLGVSLVLSLVTISIAWIVFRPLLALSILAFAIAMGGFILYLASQRRRVAIRR